MVKRKGRGEKAEPEDKRENNGRRVKWKWANIRGFHSWRTVPPPASKKMKECGCLENGVESFFKTTANLFFFSSLPFFTISPFSHLLFVFCFHPSFLISFLLFFSCYCSFSPLTSLSLFSSISSFSFHSSVHPLTPLTSPPASSFLPPLPFRFYFFLSPKLIKQLCLLIFYCYTLNIPYNLVNKYNIMYFVKFHAHSLLEITVTFMH